METIDAGFMKAVKNEKGHLLVHHPGAVAILPFIDPKTIILVQQKRWGISDAMLEIPAGTLDIDGESPADCAKRELLEETGHTADSIKQLIIYHPSVGYSNEKITIFEATGLHKVEAGEEGIITIPTPTAECYQMIKDGKITDSKTIIALLVVAVPILTHLTR